MLSYIRRHLAVKLFLSYLIVIIVGAVILIGTVELAAPTAYDRHLLAMSRMMANMMGSAGGNLPEPITPTWEMPMMGDSGMGHMVGLEFDFYNNFRAAVTEAVIFAALAAALAAGLASLLISRQVVAPVLEMRSASQRIAEGHYHERVQVSGNLEKDELDELARLALSFNVMAERLENIENLRRQLIGDVAHELRTPLTAIKGSMEGLQDGVLPASEATYQQIAAEADRLERLVDDLQELSRVEAGAFELNLQPVEVAELLNRVKERLARQFEGKGVELAVDLPANLPPVRVDRDRIDQVLTNLAGNALQYTPAGGRVEISAQVKGEQVWISVRDNGAGINAEHLPHLFTRFYRVDKSRARSGGGSGIGLTIAKHLVEAHGGRIWGESTGEGKGSMFTFTLPL